MFGVADVLLLGGDGVPAGLLREAGLGEQETGERREDQAKDVHFREISELARQLGPQPVHRGPSVPGCQAGNLA